MFDQSINNIKQDNLVKAQFKVEESRHEQELLALNEIKTANLQAMRGLIQFLDGKVTKTEITNQLNSISTPDVENVVKAVEALATKIPPQLDLSGLESGIKALEEQLKLIPKENVELPEQKEDVRVTNLGDIDFTTLEKTIVDEVSKLAKNQKAPIVDVKASDVTVNVDTKEFTKGLTELLKAVQGLEFPEVPKTDLSKVEKKLDDSNKYLKEISEKRFGGGGGGGNGSPYVDATGKPVVVELTVDGKIPVEAGATSTYESYNDTTSDTNLVYLGKALPGTATSAAGWQIKRYNKSAGHTSFADDTTTFTLIWDNRSSYGY